MKIKLKFLNKDIDIPDMLKTVVELQPDAEALKEIAALRHQVNLLEGLVTTYREQLGNFCIGLLSENPEESTLTPEEIAMDLVEIFRLENEVLGEE